MRSHIVNYKNRTSAQEARRGTPWWRRHLVNVGFFLDQVPRVVIRCRLVGHRSIVDGSDTTRVGRPAARWVVCDRCGIRPDPQGTLDPQAWAPGDPYTGPVAASAAHLRVVRDDLFDQNQAGGWQLPGPYPTHPTGGLGGQLVIAANPFGVGFEVKVGNRGSERPLAAAVYLGWLGALYLHTEEIGEWWQRRLNPAGYQSRVVEVRLDRAQLRWKLWARRDERSSTDPWWMGGTVSFRWRDKLLGHRRYSFTDVPGGVVARLVRMPEGDYLVNLTLQTVTVGRRRWRKTRRPYSVDWATLGRGIPTKGPLRGRVFGSSVTVSDQAVNAGTWPAEAVAAIGLRMAKDRTREGWEPTGAVPVTVAAS